MSRLTLYGDRKGKETKKKKHAHLNQLTKFRSFHNVIAGIIFIYSNKTNRARFVDLVFLSKNFQSSCRSGRLARNEKTPPTQRWQ
jgi:hypothetical protein